jgi:hypothetical protein
VKPPPKVTTVGQACTQNTDCGNGVCAMTFGANGLMGQTGTAAPGGYCTGACSTDTDCNENAVCSGTFGATGFIGGGGAMMAGNRGQCLLKCSVAADCRADYRCVNALGIPVGATGAAGAAAPAAGGGGAGAAGRGGIPGLGALTATTCQPAPPTDKLTGDTAGAMCSADDDCAGGRCMTMGAGLGAAAYPGGYCTGSCLQNSDCGDGICGGAALGGTGVCYRGCESDRDCGRDGYRCRTSTGGSKTCVPGAPPLADGIVGKACTADPDCGGAAMSCATMLGAGRTAATGGYCTGRCVDSTDCGTGAICVGGLGAIGGNAANGTCYKLCAAATDCREGYTCAVRGGGRGMMQMGMMTCGPTPPMMMPTDEDAGVP